MSASSATEAIQAVLFDFDGVILDTESTRLKAWAHALAAVGIAMNPQHYIRLVHTPPGCTARDLARTLTFGAATPREINEFLSAASAHNLRLSTELEVPQCLSELLNSLRTLGARTAIVSSSRRDWVTFHLRRLNLIETFDTIVCREHAPRPKPYPDLYRTALGALKASARSSIAIEDSPLGLVAAAAVPIRCIAVPNGITARLDFPGATAIYRSLDDLTVLEIVRLLEQGPARRST